jgi:hypothetical protein
MDMAVSSSRTSYLGAGPFLSASLRSIDVRKLECDTDDELQICELHQKALASVSRTLKPKLSREYHWTEANHRRGFDPGVYSSVSKPASIRFSQYLNPNLSPH